VTYKSEKVHTAKSPEQRKLHKAFLRWHDPKNWPLLRKAIADMGRQELIGEGENQLIPHYKKGEEALEYVSHRRKNSDKAHQKRVEAKEQGKQSSPKKGTILTQHTGVPPRSQADRGGNAKSNKKTKK
jgi:hypothetical protein